MAKLLVSKLLLFVAASADKAPVIIPDGTPEMILQCPLLTCEDNVLEPGICYRHDGKASAKTISG